MITHYTKDITQMRFGRLLALECVGRDKHGKALWKCLCDCGGEKTTHGNSLLRGLTQSCGCLQIQRCKEVCTTHGLVNTVEYEILKNIISRCENPGNPNYPRYGGRGIRICQSWRFNPSSFLHDMGPRPSPRHSVHRIDNDAGYFPGNCRWADDTDQNSNKRDSRWIEFAGRKMTCRQWEDELGFSHGVILARLDRGWSLEKTMTTPMRTVKVPKQYTFGERTMSLSEWSKEFGIAPETIYRRIEVQGWSTEEALTTPLVRPGSSNSGRPSKQKPPKIQTERRSRLKSNDDRAEIAERTP